MVVKLNEEALLHNHLNSLNYSIDARPVLNSSLPILVWMALRVHKIIEFDSDETLTLSGTLTTAWIDNYMVWNPADYGGLKIIYRRADTLWRSSPFTLWNAAGSAVYYTLNGSHPVMLQHDGTVAMDISSLFYVICLMDVTYFPFDSQTCNVQIKSSVLDVSHLVIVAAKKAVLSPSDPGNSEWEVDSKSITHTVRNISIPSGIEFPLGEYHTLPMSVYYLNIKLQRRPNFYVFNIIAPVCILTALSMLALFVPNSKGEQIGLTISVFLCFTVFQSYVNNFVPQTRDIPYLVSYILWELVLSALCVTSAILSLFIEDIHRPMPPWLQSIIYRIAKSCCIPFEKKENSDGNQPVKDTVRSNEPVLQEFSVPNGTSDAHSSGENGNAVPLTHLNSKHLNGMTMSIYGNGAMLMPSHSRNEQEDADPDWALFSNLLSRLLLTLIFLASLTISLYYLITIFEA